MALNSIQVSNPQFTPAATLNKPDAVGFSVSVRNNTVQWQVNVGERGAEAWVPSEAVDIYPGDYVFDAQDWEQYGVKVAQGIRFRAKAAAMNPAPVVTAS